MTNIPAQRHDTPTSLVDFTTTSTVQVADLTCFERDGFLVARGFFNPTETAQIVRWTEEVVAMPELPGRHMVYYEDSLTTPGLQLIQRIENFCQYHSKFDQLIRKGTLAYWVENLLGGPVVLFKEKINLKFSGASGFKAHQDQQAGWSKYAPLFLTALMTIDPATVENGCLELAAGRHRQGLIGEEWRPLDDDFARSCSCSDRTWRCDLFR